MSRWHENFQNHPFRATWNALKALLEQDNFVSGDNAQFKEIGRIQKVVKYVDTLIDQIDPELMPAPLLDTLNQHASGCVSELNAFKGSNNIGNLFNANTYIDSIISIFSQTPFILNGHQKGSLSKASLAYAEALDKHLEKLNVTVSSEIANVKNEMSGIRVKIEENQRALIVLNEQLQTVGQTIQQQTAEFNTQFQASEKARSLTNRTTRCAVTTARLCSLRVHESQRTSLGQKLPCFLFSVGSCSYYASENYFPLRRLIKKFWSFWIS